LQSKGWIVDSELIDPLKLDAPIEGAEYVLEHPKIPFISYPYEWSFPALKAAALLHLDIQLSALEYDVTLSDASAYNIQFIGAKPIFIDRLSFVQYHEGETWSAHRQFCEQFLNPLLLRALCGVPHNGWYRGTQEGIPTEFLKRVIPFRKKLSFNVLTHVVLQSALQASIGKNGAALQKNMSGAQFPRKSYRHMLEKLRDWIAGLNPADTGKSTWHDYAADNSYRAEEAVTKRRFIMDFVSRTHPRMTWDLGCNTGDYSIAALEAGASYAVGFDFDMGALELGYDRAAQKDLKLLPLFLDAGNPSANQGWAERERPGMKARASSDAVFALAFVHHMAITKNIPLDQLVDWIVDFAPGGVIEFVPKQDPMVQELLRFRKDCFPDYTEEHFLNCLRARAEIEKSETISSAGRLLVSYRRKT
jgi:ribosomal protein L11 methylase PrmA